MSKIPKIRTLDDSTLRKQLLSRRWPKVTRYDPELFRYVENLIGEVRKYGDSALVKLTKKFDCITFSIEDLRVNTESIEKAYENVSGCQISAIEIVKSRIETFQREILNRLYFEYSFKEVKIQPHIQPIERLGCYVPGGKAIYPSSLLMMVVPAKVAGVPQVVVCSPPQNDGKDDPFLLVAADICKVDEIYRVGGVQAVAAMAYGTSAIAPVNKLVGPGNQYVQAAKILVSKDVPIDIPAGPSEIVVLADHNANPAFVALDLISQAEHFNGVSILVTTCASLAKIVSKKIEDTIAGLPNSKMIKDNLSKNGLFLLSKDLEEAIEFINQFAPEHVEILVNDSSRIAERITSAGLVLVGPYTPVAASDYLLGTNHILPTEGFSKVYSGLSVLDFVRRFNVVKSSKEGLRNIKVPLETLAKKERLFNHALAIEGRFKDD